MSSIAQRYAEGLFKNAKSQDRLKPVLKDLLTLGSEIRQNNDLQKALANPLLPLEAYEHIFAYIAKAGKFDQLTHQFLNVVADSRRLGILEEIIQQFKDRVNRDNKVVAGRVTTAFALKDDQREALNRSLADKFQVTIDLEEAIDPTILGGMVVQVGSHVIDSSLKSHLRRLAIALQGSPESG